MRVCRRARRRGVYPRGCGGTRAVRRHRSVPLGLSPRVRGNQRCEAGPGQRQGSIPAGAGEPRRRAAGASPPGVYPRGCGGTSPTSTPQFVRLYPRRCGETTHRRSNWRNMGGLSRRCGRPPPSGSAMTSKRGSIPGVRGNWLVMGTRAIMVDPRGAGEPGIPHRIVPPRRWVYPRGCGENRSETAKRPDDPGLLPAGAGEPDVGHVDVLSDGVYPRGCGGTTAPFGPPASGRGLSPRVRGNRRRSCRRPPRGGSIPAGAGEPRYRPAYPPSRGVYPRGCGGTTSRNVGSPAARGLSPRVRGNLWPFWPIRWEESRLSQASELRERSLRISFQLSKSADRRTITTS